VNDSTHYKQTTKQLTDNSTMCYSRINAAQVKNYSLCLNCRLVIIQYVVTSIGFNVSFWALVHFRTLVTLRRVRVRVMVGLELRLVLVRVRIRVRVRIGLDLGLGLG